MSLYYIFPNPYIYYFHECMIFNEKNEERQEININALRNDAKTWGRGTSSNCRNTDPIMGLWWNEQSSKMNKNSETSGRRAEPRWSKPRKAFTLFYWFKTIQLQKKAKASNFPLRCHDFSQWEKQWSCKAEWKIMHSSLKCIVTAYLVI